MSAQFAHKPSPGPKRAERTFDRSIGIVFDPMQHGIGKDGIELVLKLVLKAQHTGVHYPRVKTALKSGRDHVWRTVDPHHLRTERNQFFGQCPVAATQIKDALPRLRLEQIQYRLPERRHKMSIRGISSRIPT